MRYFKRID